MSSRILFDAEFPHGEPDGYSRGCRGAHCPAIVSCRDVHQRYAADWSFRSRIDAGMAAVEIESEAEREREAARRAVADAKTAARRLATNEARKAARQAHTKPQTQRTLVPALLVKDLHTEGLTDTQIGERLGFTRKQINDARRKLNLPPNPRPPRSPKPKRERKPRGPRPGSIRAEVLRLHAEGLTDREMAEQLGANHHSVSEARRTAGLVANKKTPNEQVRELHATGADDVQIGAALGLSFRHVGKIRRDLDLPPNVVKRTIDTKLADIAHLSDDQAAERLGCTVKHVQRRRRHIRNTHQTPAVAGVLSYQESTP